MNYTSAFKRTLNSVKRDLYYNPHHEQVIEQQRQFTKVAKLTFYDDRFTIYTN